MSVEVTDPDFKRAIELIDAGDCVALAKMLDAQPRLLVDRVPLADDAAGAYFANPKLIWFVAENPVRNGTLPDNIANVVIAIIEAARKHAVAELKADLDYTLALVASGRVARETGAQEPLIQVLTGAGAQTNGAVMAALGHREVAAARCLLHCGADLSVQLAAGLDQADDVARLAVQATPADLQEAMTIAAVNGAEAAIGVLVRSGANPNLFNPKHLHAHSTPLHQAVDSGSLATVRALVDAGAAIDTRDTLFGGDARGWAHHLGQKEIGDYLDTLIS